MRGRSVTLALLAAALALAACGDKDGASGSRPQRLSASERASVAASERAIRSYCRRVGLYLARRSGPPTPERTGAAFDAVDRIVGLAQHKPDAPYNELEKMRDVVGDVAENLEGTDCSDQLVQRLNEGQASLPSP